MADQHAHRLKYTVHMRPSQWWQRRGTVKVFYGTGSSKQDNELIIVMGNGNFYSINYDRVDYVWAEVIE